ncbi:hypothetical protein ACPFUP_001988 [Vibrio cholerae]
MELQISFYMLLVYVLALVYLNFRGAIVMGNKDEEFEAAKPVDLGAVGCESLTK